MKTAPVVAVPPKSSAKTKTTDLIAAPVGRYERRVAVVRSVLVTQGSLAESTADTLARQVLDAIDHIPEIVR